MKQLQNYNSVCFYACIFNDKVKWLYLPFWKCDIYWMCVSNDALPFGSVIFIGYLCVLPYPFGSVIFIGYLCVLPYPFGSVIFIGYLCVLPYPFGSVISVGCL
jgi:hypothetical protein